ncbi:nitroreductase [Furfurilactobacillus rossiae]|uniref:Nitroreductase n=1 Tax=Furfurilactobacillus rossiae DSM 15814 TaxID=1114972 RepID=A0A0R1RE98_9LACO|nr:nitroreductase [Furfurilactobacillus rossiae]KRL55068.1 nitroreductase [Furfurilactobacillus rossiae DSM 15814]QFR67718.1 nitroreductase [Furfurilactobacillus rossiae]QLE60684.1 p-nitrobenzoate reductase [Furfurilactobacillus rossiae]
METRSAIYGRHSVRDFSDRPIDLATVKAIIKDASQAPSWANSQPWSVYVATGDTLAQIRAVNQQRVLTGQNGTPDLAIAHREQWSSRSQQAMADWNETMTETIADTSTDVEEQTTQAAANLFNAPVVVYFTVQKNATGYSLFDTGSFAQTLMLSATDRGVDSMPAYALIAYPDVLRSALSIPSDQEIVMGVALGHAKVDDKINTVAPGRLALADFVHIAE